MARKVTKSVRKPVTVAPALNLPKDVLESDTHYPKWSSRQSAKTRRDNEIVQSITLYDTEGFGWVVCTLPIGGNRRGQSTQRTYAIRMSDEQLVSVGRGPHVKSVVQLHITRKRAAALDTYIKLHQKGMGAAGSYRDNLSTRRMASRSRRGFPHLF